MKSKQLCKFDVIYKHKLAGSENIEVTDLQQIVHCLVPLSPPTIS